MLNNLPFDGEYPIVQQFGDSPRTFRRVRCSGVPLRGHHGVDFGMPVGTPVLAVAGGTVVAARHHAEGFGHYVLLEHHWGQSFYAHLSRLDITAGAELRAGDAIGLSGNSGLSLWPHLHFGLRVNPYTLNDRWCGYTDPAPYLHRIVFGRGPLNGPHIIGSVPAHLETLRRWQPRLITVLEPNPDEIGRLRRVCPNTVIVGRVFVPDHLVSERILSGPRAAARWAHEQTIPHLSDDVDYWQFTNEVLQDEAGLPLLNQFELARMQLAESEGYACALFGFSVGNPDLPEDDRMARWRLVYPALERAEVEGHIVALHQYGMPDLWGPDNLYDWYIYRLEHQILRRIPFKRLHFAVTEIGIDGLIGGSKARGWRKFTDSADYTRQLMHNAAYAERYSGRVLGASVFTLGHFPPWDSYDIEGDVGQNLATESDRGTWSEVDIEAEDIVPGNFSPTRSPGVEALPDTAPDDDEDEEKPSEPEKPLVSRRLDPRFNIYNMEVKSLCDRQDLPDGDVVYLIKDVFMTANGSWETEGKPGQVPIWARNDYLTRDFLEAGADRHLFAAVIGLDGKFIPNQRITYWSDGFPRLEDPDYDGFFSVPVKPETGWANMPMSAGSSFDPDRGESGPWCWMPSGPAEVICGGGLPLNHHVSTFVVWQAVARDEWEARKQCASIERLPYPGASLYPTRRRLSFCVPYYGLTIQRLTRSTPALHEKTAYVVRDLFTVSARDDGGCPGIDAIPPWASQEYLIPSLGPDGDSGKSGLARIYAAVRSRDGFLIPAKEIVFTRDGFHALRTADSGRRVLRYTDTESRWAHLDLDAQDAYSPLRNQTGPWCWAPNGAVEAVCGGGLPFGEPVSIFAVWEPVRLRA